MRRTRPQLHYDLVIEIAFSLLVAGIFALAIAAVVYGLVHT